MHILNVNISQTVSDRENITIAIKYESHMRFLLAYLALSLTHSKGQDHG